VTSLAWKNLVREKTRLAISVGGVAFAVVLILLVRGLYNVADRVLWLEDGRLRDRLREAESSPSTRSAE